MPASAAKVFSENCGQNATRTSFRPRRVSQNAPTHAAHPHAPRRWGPGQVQRPDQSCPRRAPRRAPRLCSLAPPRKTKQRCPAHRPRRVPRRVPTRQPGEHQHMSQVMADQGQRESNTKAAQKTAPVCCVWRNAIGWYGVRGQRAIARVRRGGEKSEKWHGKPLLEVWCVVCVFKE